MFPPFCFKDHLFLALLAPWYWVKVGVQRKVGSIFHEKYQKAKIGYNLKEVMLQADKEVLYFRWVRTANFVKTLRLYSLSLLIKENLILIEHKKLNSLGLKMLNVKS